MACDEQAFGQLDLFGRCPCRLHSLLRTVTRLIEEHLPSDIDAVQEIVGEMLAVLEDAAPSTRRELLKNFRRFVGWCRAMGIRDIGEIGPDEATTFIFLPVVTERAARKPKFSTCNNRRMALRKVYKVLRTLGYQLSDPTIDVVLPSEASDKVKACSDSELSRLRRSLHSDLSGTPFACVLALAEAGATNGEIATITAAEVDLSAGTVVLRGNLRTRPRVNGLTAWGLSVITHRLTEIATADLIVQNADGEMASTSVVSQNFAMIVALARVYHRRFSIDSVRYWGARQVYDRTGRIEDAAHFLGNASLNVTATGIGLDWRSKT